MHLSLLIPLTGIQSIMGGMAEMVSILGTVVPFSNYHSNDLVSVFQQQTRKRRVNSS